MSTEENSSYSEQISALLKRAYMFLEDGEWDNASAYGERVLDMDPENARAYLCKMLAELKLNGKEKLADCNKPFDSNANYNKIVRFADEPLKAELEGYLAAIKSRLASKSTEAKYQSACQILNNSMDVQDLQKAASMFSDLGDYKDSAELASKCSEKTKTIAAEKEAVKQKEADRRAAYNAYLEKYPLLKQIWKICLMKLLL